MSYDAIRNRFDAHELVILDGATGTELERRGVPMDHEAWSALACLEYKDVLERVHLDYIEAGSRVITANTFSSSRLMLESAGYGDRVDDVNRIAVDCAQNARTQSGISDIAVAGSISHWTEGQPGRPKPSDQKLSDTFGEMVAIFKGAGADLILLEMMYIPKRIELVLSAVLESGLPVWVGFSARRSDSGQLLSFQPGEDIPFSEIACLANRPGVAAAGVMHTPSNLVSEALSTIRKAFTGPTYAYPDSGTFEMPHWKFDDVIEPEDFATFVSEWKANGLGAVGGCCGLTPDHIRPVSHLSRED